MANTVSPMLEVLTYALTLVGGYLVCVCVYSFCKQRHEQAHALTPPSGNQQFFFANKQLQGMWLAASFAACWFGATSTKGSLDAYYHEGLSGAWKIALPSLFSLLLLRLWIAKRVFHQPDVTLPQAIERAYGQWGRGVLSLSLLTQGMATLAAQLLAVYGVLMATFGSTVASVGITLMMLAVSTYCMWGGFATVALTDGWQLMLMLGCFAGLLGWLGWAYWHDATPFLHFWQHQGDSYTQVLQGWHEHWATTLTVAIAWALAPEMWQRMKATSTEKTALQAVHWGWVALALLYGGVACIGLLAGGVIGVSPPAGGASDVLSRLALTAPHPLLGALLVVAFLTAVTSTMDSVLHCASLTFSHDVVHRFIWPKATPDQVLRVAKLSLWLLPLPALAIALQAPSLFSVIWFAADVYACTATVPLIVVLATAHPHRLAGQVAFGVGCAGATLIAWVHYAKLPCFGLPTEAPYALGTMLASAVAYAGVASLVPRRGSTTSQTQIPTQETSA
ncbi:MAG: sodium:solute symporter family transporter [Vampirovibrionales bacterium]